MSFQTIRPPSNFRFASAHAGDTLRLGDAAPLQTRVRDLGEDVFHVELADPARWPSAPRPVRMQDDAFSGLSRHSLRFDPDGTLQLAGLDTLSGVPGACVGVCGPAWRVQLARREHMRFYGQGGQATGLEKTGQHTGFGNRGVDQPDPRHAAIPYLLIRNGSQWIGVLVDHPGNVFIDTGSDGFSSDQDEAGAPPSLWFGADEGSPAFYVIAGASAASVTQRLQRLVGVTPVPPLWSLCDHPARWPKAAGTGAAASGWDHLRTCIPDALDLALSGVPFNGPDVPDFVGPDDAELAIAWHKAVMLFPRLCNRAADGPAPQLGPDALAIIRHCMRLRRKLLPALYQLWIEQAREGTAVMRPLFHDFDGGDGLDLDFIDDQFLVGPALMQAPLVVRGPQRRTVALPGIGRWMDAGSGEFIEPGRSMHVRSDAASTPLYLREGHLLAMQPGEPATQPDDLSEIELHVILGRDCGETAVLDYAFDDGRPTGCERGVVRFHATRRGDEIALRAEVLQAGWKALRVSVVGYDGARSAVIALASGEVAQALVADAWRFAGRPLAVGRGAWVTV